MITEPGNKIGEETFVTVPALGMILDRERKRIIAQPHLLDDVVGLAPGLHFEAVPEPIDGLVMGAVDAIEAMRGRAIGAQWLNVVSLHFRRVVPGNIEAQGAAQRDVKKLHAFANREDWQAPFE